MTELDFREEEWRKLVVAEGAEIRCVGIARLAVAEADERHGQDSRHKKAPRAVAAALLRFVRCQ